jgi:hypothetical protein
MLRREPADGPARRMLRLPAHIDSSREHQSYFDHTEERIRSTQSRYFSSESRCFRWEQRGPSEGRRAQKPQDYCVVQKRNRVQMIANRCLAEVNRDPKNRVMKHTTDPLQDYDALGDVCFPRGSFVIPRTLRDLRVLIGQLETSDVHPAHVALQEYENYRRILSRLQTLIENRDDASLEMNITPSARYDAGQIITFLLHEMHVLSVQARQAMIAPHRDTLRSRLRRLLSAASFF